MSLPEYRKLNEPQGKRGLSTVAKQYLLVVAETQLKTKILTLLHSDHKIKGNSPL